MFLQRENELKILTDNYNSANSSLDFIFGPRNSGKTALLNEFSKNKDRIFFANYEMIPSQFFTQFANVINNYFYKTDITFTFNTFLEVLEFINKQNLEKKLVIVIDDFQNILKVDKNALEDLFKFWKKALKNKNIQLLIASATLFDDKYSKELYRVSNSVQDLSFLDFVSIKEFFPSMNRVDQLYVYSLLGTTPTNLKYYNPKIDFSENIYNLFLSPNSYLFDYGIRILKNEISDIGTYSSILYAISKGNTKIGDIANTLEVKSTYLTRYMQKLIDMMIIRKNVPVGEDKKQSKFGRYEIMDNALKFWFSYIYPNFSSLQLGEINHVQKQIEDEFISKTVFLTYKKCIKEFVLDKQEEIFGYKPVAIDSWWDNHNNSIDLVAYNKKVATFIQILWEDKDMAKISYGRLKEASLKFETTLERKYIIVTKETFFNIK